jgi:hypothetical protein
VRETWNDMVDNPESIRRLYDIPPPLKGVEIAAIDLSREASSLTIRLFLPSFPDNPPGRWPKQYNRAIMTLYAYGVSGLELLGWGWSIIEVTFDFARPPGGRLEMRATGQNIQLAFECDGVRVSGVNGYEYKSSTE